MGGRGEGGEGRGGGELVRVALACSGILMAWLSPILDSCEPQGRYLSSRHGRAGPRHIEYIGGTPVDDEAVVGWVSED